MRSWCRLANFLFALVLLLAFAGGAIGHAHAPRLLLLLLPLAFAVVGASDSAPRWLARVAQALSMAGSIFACVGLAAAIASLVSGGFIAVSLVLAVAFVLYVGNIGVLSGLLASPVRG